METTATPKAGEELVLRQATDIVGEAVREALVAALRAAAVCGCRGCRAAAPRTFLWAAAMLSADGGAERPSPEVLFPLRGNGGAQPRA